MIINAQCLPILLLGNREQFVTNVEEDQLLTEYVGQAAGSVLTGRAMHREVLWLSGCVKQGLSHKL